MGMRTKEELSTYRVFGSISSCFSTFELPQKTKISFVIFNHRTDFQTWLEEKGVSYLLCIVPHVWDGSEILHSGTLLETRV